MLMLSVYDSISPDLTNNRHFVHVMYTARKHKYNTALDFNSRNIPRFPPAHNAEFYFRYHQTVFAVCWFVMFANSCCTVYFDGILALSISFFLSCRRWPCSERSLCMCVVCLNVFASCKYEKIASEIVPSYPSCRRITNKTLRACVCVFLCQCHGQFSTSQVEMFEIGWREIQHVHLLLIIRETSYRNINFRQYAY